MASSAPPTAPGPPPGPVPDFPTGPAQASDHSPEILAAAWTFLGLASIALGLRVYCKWSSGRRLWWDDGVLIASWVAFVIDVSMTIYLVDLGLGRAQSIFALDMDNMRKFVLAILVRGTFAITSIAWSKTGFAITMLRLTDGWVKRFIWFIIVTVNVALGITALLQWVGCTPVQSNWDPAVPQRHCLPGKSVLAYNLFSGSWSAAADIVLAVLPWQVLAQLQMNRREKIGAGIAMSMGIIAGIVAIVKTTNLNKIYGSDQTKGHILMIWDLAETGVTIIAASIPALRLLFRQVRSGGTKLSGTGPHRYAMSNLKHTNVSNRPKCLESQNDDDGAFDDAHYVAPATDARSDKGILETRVISTERHQTEVMTERKEPWQ
ncbi:hypothetical protein QBC39DRAFT_104917 [Podospora conica]|nr:hypothetical protein QBC39DRAFT_104917 [Schizothecium conicum]